LLQSGLVLSSGKDWQVVNFSSPGSFDVGMQVLILRVASAPPACVDGYLSTSRSGQLGPIIPHLKFQGDLPVDFLYNLMLISCEA